MWKTKLLMQALLHLLGPFKPAMMFQKPAHFKLKSIRCALTYQQKAGF